MKFPYETFSILLTIAFLMQLSINSSSYFLLLNSSCILCTMGTHLKYVCGNFFLLSLCFRTLLLNGDPVIIRLGEVSRKYGLLCLIKRLLLFSVNLFSFTLLILVENWIFVLLKYILHLNTLKKENAASFTFCEEKQNIWRGK